MCSQNVPALPVPYPLVRFWTSRRPGLAIWCPMVGKRFGRLVVLERCGRDAHHNILWRCRCDCGVVRLVRASHLRMGQVQSCGCWKKDCMKCRRPSKNEHGMSRSPTYGSWMAMRDRCTRRSHPAWARYGGRGIVVCERWNDFRAFLADMGKRPAGKGLDRIDNDGDYEPGNCRWATSKENGRHRCTTRWLTLGGETHCLSEWSEKTGIMVTTIRERLRRKWTVQDALTIPPKGGAHAQIRPVAAR